MRLENSHYVKAEEGKRGQEKAEVDAGQRDPALDIHRGPRYRD